MTSSIKNYVILLLLAIISISQHSGLVSAHNRVKIANGLFDERGTHVLTIHCESGHDDLGVRQLEFGATWDWIFKVNFIATTLFSCDFSFPPNHGGSFKVFYVDTPLTKYCYENCEWMAKREGLFLYNANTKLWIKFHDWER